MGILKKASAQTNAELGELSTELARLIIAASDEVIDGKLDQTTGNDQTGLRHH